MIRKEVDLKDIAKHWNISIAQMRPDIVIVGSPERTSFRAVVENEEGSLFIIEQIPSFLYEHKNTIIQVLERLRNEGLEVQSYLKGTTGKAVQEIEDAFWQVVPFVPGIDINPPQYAFEKWKGPLVVDFLSKMQSAAQTVEGLVDDTPFYLPAYIDNLMKVIHTARPQVARRIRPFQEFLKNELYPVYDDLTLRFCHGDLHVGNIIWGYKEIRTVIDWEFLGYKPALYDVANFLGCLGIEDPESFGGPLVKSFFENLKTCDFFEELDIKTLLSLIIGLRFAWISEWLRKKDEEMLKLECDYFELLIENKKAIESLWGIA